MERPQTWAGVESKYISAFWFGKFSDTSSLIMVRLLVKRVTLRISKTRDQVVWDHKTRAFVVPMEWRPANASRRLPNSPPSKWKYWFNAYEGKYYTKSELHQIIKARCATMNKNTFIPLGFALFLLMFYATFLLFSSFLQQPPIREFDTTRKNEEMIL
jgi:hypothetical protein